MLISYGDGLGHKLMKPLQVKKRILLFPVSTPTEMTPDCAPNLEDNRLVFRFRKAVTTDIVAVHWKCPMRSMKSTHIP
jgi:hypothetical protein